MKIKYLTQVITIFLLTCTLTAFANFPQELPQAESVPGGVKILTFHAEGFKQPKAYFQNHRLLLITNKRDHLYYAIVGIPLSTKPQNYFINITLKNGKTINKQFTVNKKNYPIKYLQGDNLSPINKSTNLCSMPNKLKLTWTENLPTKLYFKLPIEGRVIGDFGLQRFYNNQPRKPHNGLDIAAPFNSYVKAPMEGEVLAVSNYDDTGNTVLLNHGSGLLTMYAHLNRIFVKKGQHLKAREIIGSVGQSGIVSQAHLHWSVILNGVFVDPKLFLQK